MPLYVFQCVECDKSFEQHKKLALDNPSCPDCEGETEISITHAPPALFKCSGFHKTDYWGNTKFSTESDPID